MSYTDEAFDVGKVKIKTESDNVTLHVQNEFMAVDSQALGRVATYPDVITLFRAKDAKALSTDEISIDVEVVVFKISLKHFPFSSGVKDPSVYPEVENVLGIDLYRHDFK